MLMLLLITAMMLMLSRPRYALMLQLMHCFFTPRMPPRLDYACCRVLMTPMLRYAAPRL